MPVAGAQDDGNDAGLSPFVALHGADHLDVIAVVGCEEVRAHQEQHDVRGVELIVDLAVQFLTGANSAIMPSRDHVLAAEHGKMFLKLVSQRLVGVRVGEKDMGLGL